MKKAITFETFKKYCRNVKFVDMNAGEEEVFSPAGACWLLVDKRGEGVRDEKCAIKNCPVWKRLRFAITLQGRRSMKKRKEI
ncbi:MAG: hypothetical protein GY861_15555 [bacterium]|nr:hypothetical protein [bacterium]